MTGHYQAPHEMEEADPIFSQDALFADLNHLILDPLTTSLADFTDLDTFGIEQGFNNGSPLDAILDTDINSDGIIPSASTSGLPTPLRSPHAFTQHHFTSTSPSQTPESGHDLTTTEPNSAKPPPKIGARFSKEAVHILRHWFFANESHPYPKEEEKELLQNQTGLSKTQISNWLANARRRRMTMRTTQSTPVQSSTGPMEIPQRPGTPSAESRRWHLNPLERWVDSPPEDEPASVTAIARALSYKHSRTNSPFGNDPNRRDTEKYLAEAFHPSSTGTSRSSVSSFSSANSHDSRAHSRASRASRGSSASSEMARPRARIRKRYSKRRSNVRTALAAPPNRYQCTFCTETFRTKHDWQRHEKSLHLPLERWVCSPNGHRITDAQSGQTCCAFCGEANPDDAHIERHNPSLCRERTFSRKDHLKQHLRLVHGTTLVEWLTQGWKISSPQIQSRCGFCGISMDTWEFRTDHLADHFKMGQTMADWQGEWGFDVDVLKLVENSIPPYLIDSERKTPAPFMASNAPAESPRYGYELIQSELMWFLQNYDHKPGGIPDSAALQLEACRIIYAAEAMMDEATLEPSPVSWLRDLILANNEIAQQAQFGPLRSQAESALTVPKLQARMALFQDCPLEIQLREFVQAQWSKSRMVLSDSELQVEACRIISSISQGSTALPFNYVSTWLIMLIGSSTDWLAGFRARAYTSLLLNSGSQPGEPSVIEAQNSTRQELSFLQEPDPMSADDSMGGQTDTNAQWPPLRGQGFPLEGVSVPTSGLSCAPLTNHTHSLFEAPNQTSKGSGYDHRPPWVKQNLLFLNDANFHRWLARELGRWVASTTSPNNPSRHTPSDEELRHQARCICYDDDDPWNFTAADNAEWLRRFKRDFGIGVSNETNG